MTPPRVLVAGVGNIFLGDDAFGVEVVRRLAGRDLPAGVRVVDFGIRGLDLTFALLDGPEAVVIVDAVARGGRPGTLYVIEPTVEGPPGAEGEGLPAGGHGMDPVKVLRLAASMGARVDKLLVVGCEPGPDCGEDEIRDGLSEPVRGAVGEAVVLVTALVTRLLRGEGERVVAAESSIPGREVEACQD